MKKVLLTLLAFMVTVAMNAEQISKQQALQKAQQFMPGKQFGEARSFARSAGSSEREPFYVFNAGGNQGFVIVSGDDRTTEILGYSNTGTLDMEQLPENLKWWLDSYARQIEALGTSAKPAKKAKADKAAKNQPNKVVKYFRDLRSEFKKVVWPSKNTVITNTGVVIGSMIVTGIGVFAMDYVFALMFEKLMGLMK